MRHKDLRLRSSLVRMSELAAQHLGLSEGGPRLFDSTAFKERCGETNTVAVSWRNLRSRLSILVAPRLAMSLMIPVVSLASIDSTI